jgi:membrane protease YdiL (CAAX protease family)
MTNSHPNEHPSRDESRTMPEPVRSTAPRGPRGWSLPAWIVILLGVALAIALAQLGKQELSGGTDDPIGNTLMEIQGRYLVGAAESFGSGGELYLQSSQFNTGTVGQRQRFVVLAAELAGPDTARTVLDELDDLIEEEQQTTAGDDEPFELTAEQERVQRILTSLYAPLQGTSLEEDTEDQVAADKVDLDALNEGDQETLQEHLGWYGSLALAPRGVDADRRAAVIRPAVVTFWVFIGAISGVGLVGLVGLIALIVTIALAAVGRLRSGIDARRAHHGIYAETFAIWLVVFFGLQIGAELIGGLLPDLTLLIIFVAMLASLGVLIWPVLRGVPWSSVRADIGWTGGRQPIVEVLFGIGGYAMALPLLGIGLIITLVLVMIQTQMQGDLGTFAPSGGPAHPIIVEISDGNLLMITQVLLLGVIAAPIVEETMFRGVLYRHLRDASRTLGTVLSIVVAVTVNGLIFAVIHPQGIVAIPALFALAAGFALVREWRGTLVPSMIMHGINNGLVLGLLSLICAL